MILTGSDDDADANAETTQRSAVNARQKQNSTTEQLHSRQDTSEKFLSLYIIRSEVQTSTVHSAPRPSLI